MTVYRFLDSITFTGADNIRRRYTQGEQYELADADAIALALYVVWADPGPPPVPEPEPDAPDFLVRWEPAELDLPNMIGLYAYGDLPGVTSLTFNQTTSIAGFDIEGMEDLETLSFPNLVSVDPDNTQYGYLFFADLPSLASVNLPLYKTAGGPFGCIYCDVLTSLALPSLETIGQHFRIENNPSIETMDLSSFETVGENLNIAVNESLTTLDLSALTSGGRDIAIQQNSVLTTIDLSALISTASQIRIVFNPNLTTIDLSALVPNNGSVDFYSNNALTAATVNHILARYVANAEYVSGTLTLSDGTNAAPTGQGLLDVIALRARGVTVLVNGEE